MLKTSLQKLSQIHGFTLIEALVAVAVLSIISAIGYPYLTDYIIKTRILAGQRVLAEISIAQERFYSINRRYAATPSMAGVIHVSDDVQRTYEPINIVVNEPTANQLALPSLTPSTIQGVGTADLSLTKPGYVATMTPRATGMLKDTFRLAINSDGQKWFESDIAVGGCNTTANWASRCTPNIPASFDKANCKTDQQWSVGLDHHARYRRSKCP